LPLLANLDEAREPMRTGYIDRLIGEDRERQTGNNTSFLSSFLPGASTISRREFLLPVFPFADDGSVSVSNRYPSVWRRRKEAVVYFFSQYWRVILMAVIIILIILEILD
jgi:hypothetical protein